MTVLLESILSIGVHCISVSVCSIRVVEQRSVNNKLLFIFTYGIFFTVVLKIGLFVLRQWNVVVRL